MKNKKHIDKTEHKNNENSIEQLEKNKEIQLVRSDGAVTIEVDSQQVTRVPYGIALSCKTEEEGYFLLAADGVKTGGIKENSGAMTHVGKLWGWTNGNSTIEDLSVIDWHGNVVYHAADGIDTRNIKVSANRKILFLQNPTDPYIPYVLNTPVM